MRYPLELQENQKVVFSKGVRSRRSSLIRFLLLIYLIEGEVRERDGARPSGRIRDDPIYLTLHPFLFFLISLSSIVTRQRDGW